MLSHEEMIRFQAENHDLTDIHNFRSQEEYVLHLIHTFAYVQASRLAENKTVLDLGCNTGYGSEILFNSAKKVVGVDVSEKAISIANSQYGHLGVTFQLIDGVQLPFDDNEFDVIVSCQVIEHVVNHDVYIGELKRVLSSSGIVIYTTPNALLRLDPGMKPLSEFHACEFDHSTLESLLSTYFSAVRILGLFAKEPLYSIEKNRLNRGREEARRRRNHIRSLIKTILPNSILTGLRRIVSSYSHITPIYGMEDFFYSSNDLETALDLLAVCSDDESGLQEIRHIYPL